MKPILWQRAVRRSRLSKHARWVGLMLSTYANAEGAGAHPGNPQLAADTGLSLRTVKAGMSELRRMKWVEDDDSEPVDNSGPGRRAACLKLRDPRAN